MKGQRVLSPKIKLLFVVGIFLTLSGPAWEVPLLMRYHPQFLLEEFIKGGENNVKLSNSQDGD